MAGEDLAVARSIAVSPARLPGWIERFRLRHGELATSASADALLLRAADTATARLVNPWEPWPGGSIDDFIAHAARQRRFALLLARRGANAVAVVSGNELVAHRVSRHYVQGRTKAGGWSQQRFARRRQNQADQAFERAATDAAEVLLPKLAGLTGLVVAGDRGALARVLADPRLARLAQLPTRHLAIDLPEPRFAVLEQAAAAACEVPIELDAAAIADPGGGSN